MDDHADSLLLSRWLTGDREAFAVIVARHHGLVQAACRRQAPATEVDDCVQAVFLLLARKPASAARAPVLAAWLQRVAWFVCRTARRAAQRRRQAEREAAQAAPAGPARNEALEHLDDCLLKLPARQREAVVMHYLAGKPAEEVASALGTSRDNAYQLISRGLAALRGLLERRGIAVAGAALLSLLAAEAQAASASAPAAAISSVITTTTATPSTGVAALAHGAQTAMTVTALTPFAAVAGLLLAAGTLTVALAVEQAPPNVPADPNVPATSAPANPAPSTSALANGGPTGPATTQGGASTVADPTRATQVQGAGSVPGTAVGQNPGRASQVQGGGLTPNTASGQNGNADPLAARLATPVTLQFQDTPLVEVIAFVEKASGIDIIFEPAEVANAVVTLKVEQMPLGQALAWIEQLNGLKHSLVSGRYRIHR